VQKRGAFSKEIPFFVLVSTGPWIGNALLVECPGTDPDILSGAQMIKR